MPLNLTAENRRAWTGGDTPPPGFRNRCPDYRRLVTAFFREQLQQCGGLDLWKFHSPRREEGDRLVTSSATFTGTGCIERARIFWNRARLDAWRTYTESRPFPTQLAVAFRLDYRPPWKRGDQPKRIKLGRVTFPIGEHIEDAERRVRLEFPEATHCNLYDERGQWFCAGSL